KFLRPGFTRDMFDNYWLGKGDVILSHERFKDIADRARTRQPQSLKDVTGPNGESLQQRGYNLYGFPDYRRSLGSSTLFYDAGGKPVGLYDNYNFDSGGKDRDWVSEALTQAMHLLPKP